MDDQSRLRPFDPGVSENSSANILLRRLPVVVVQQPAEAVSHLHPALAHGRSAGDQGVIEALVRAFTKDAHGNVTGALSTGRDITSLKLVEKELRERGEELARANEALRLSVQAGNVGLWDWDLKTSQVRYSPEWKRQIGYEDHEIGNSFQEWENRVHPEDLEETLAGSRRRSNRASGNSFIASTLTETWRARASDSRWCRR